MRATWVSKSTAGLKHDPGSYVHHEDAGVMTRAGYGDTACPYCGDRLKEPSGAFARIYRIERRYDDGSVDALIQAIPSTHRVLGCATCKQGFTQPITVDGD